MGLTRLTPRMNQSQLSQITAAYRVIVTDRNVGPKLRKYGMILYVLDIQHFAKAIKTQKRQIKFMLRGVYSAYSAFIEQQWQFVQALRWVATGVISKGKLCFSFNLSALNPIRAEQQNNMDYTVTQTRMLKSEMIVFNFIWVS